MGLILTSSTDARRLVVVLRDRRRGRVVRGLAAGLRAGKQQVVSRLILDQRAGQSQEEAAVAQGVGMIVPGGDLQARRIEPVEGVAQVVDGQGMVAGDRLQAGNRLGPGQRRIGLADSWNDHDHQRHPRGPAFSGQGAERRIVELPVVGPQLGLDLLLEDQPSLAVDLILLGAGRRRGRAWP